MDMKSLILEKYDVESEKHFHEAQSKMLSISVRADHASMLRAIADRFGESVSSLAGFILQQSVEEAFLFISQEDKNNLSEKADKETNEFLYKKGIDGETNHWRYIASMFRETGITGEEIMDDKAARARGDL